MGNKVSIYKRTIIVAKLISESIAFAVSQLKGDKFRTLLSLLGVSIGIFCIVAIFTAIDALDKNVREGLDTISGDLIQISKFPQQSEGEYKWWEYMSRPSSTFQEYKFIKENSKLAEAVSFSIFVHTTAKRGSNSVQVKSLVSVSTDFAKIVKIDFDSGRFFSSDEARLGVRVSVIGYEVAPKLFPVIGRATV